MTLLFRLLRLAASLQSLLRRVDSGCLPSLKVAFVYSKCFYQSLLFYIFQSNIHTLFYQYSYTHKQESLIHF